MVCRTRLADPSASAGTAGPRRGDPAQLLWRPTGGGKTLAGFLPSLVELAEGGQQGSSHALHLAAQGAGRRYPPQPDHAHRRDGAADPRRGSHRRHQCYTQAARQRADPPHILLTTPESLALLLSYEDAPQMFAGLSRVVVDEIHALAESKRGDQLMLCLSPLADPVPRACGASACRQRSKTPQPLPASWPDTPIPARS